MDTFLQAVFLASLIAALPALGAAAYAERKLKSRLREHHAELWAEIAPNPRAQSSLSSRFARFITQRHYLAVQDPELTRLGERARFALHLSVSLFLLIIVFGLAADMTMDFA